MYGVGSLPELKTAVESPAALQNLQGSQDLMESSWFQRALSRLYTGPTGGAASNGIPNTTGCQVISESSKPQ